MFISYDLSYIINSRVAATIMMVPRSFLYGSPPSVSSLSLNQNEKEEAVLKTGNPSTTERSGGTGISRKPPRISNAPPPEPSKPVVIPTRTRIGVQHRFRENFIEPRTSRKEDKSSHNSQLLPPSVAALLAITSIPKSKYHSKGRIDRQNVGRCEKYSRANSEALVHTLSNFSPQSWEVLLSPPNEPEPDDFSISSDRTWDPPSIRSLSNESMPSLEADMDSSSSISSSSVPETPFQRRPAANRRPKTLISSLSEDCFREHPLVLTLASENDGPGLELLVRSDDTKPDPSEIQAQAISKSLFRSNITASLRRLKSAAVSFSNFTAPITQRDDYLASSLLSMSPQLTDERRPLPSTNVPDPALRRYLNPTIMSPAELYFHQPRLSRHVYTASIQMQTVRRRTMQSQKATAPPIFTLSPLSLPSDEPYTTSFSRQREPRENSDFLRIIVLEMNMRKSGKLADNAPGKARIWLPPRQGPIRFEAEEDAGIPRRWISTVL